MSNDRKIKVEKTKTKILYECTIISKKIFVPFFVKMNYIFLKKQLNQTPIVPMQPESFENILDMVHDCYQDNKNMNTVVTEFFSETKEMYYEAMQKSVVQNVLIAPKIKGLENEISGPPPKEPE